MSRYALYTRLTALVVALAALAGALGDAPWGPN